MISKEMRAFLASFSSSAEKKALRQSRKKGLGLMPLWRHLRFLKVSYERISSSVVGLLGGVYLLVRDQTEQFCCFTVVVIGSARLLVTTRS